MEGNPVTSELDQLTWHVSRLGELIEVLAQKAKLYPKAKEIPPLPELLWHANSEDLGQWLDSASSGMGLEVEAIDVVYTDVEDMIRNAAPAVLKLPREVITHTQTIFVQDGDDLYLGLVKGGKNKVSILRPDGSVRRIEVEKLRQWLCYVNEAPFAESLDELLTETEVPEERRELVRKALLREQLSAIKIDVGWMIRQSPGMDFWNQIRTQRLYKPLIFLLLSQFGQQTVGVLSWWLVGMGVFQGHFEWVWLWAWALVLFTTIPLQLLSTQAQNQISISTGALFKQRLLYGVLKLEPEEIRNQGAGQFLSRVMESSAVEMLALSGGFLAVMAVMQLGWAGWVLTRGAGGALHMLLLFIWVFVAFISAWRFYRSIMEWTDAYRNMTNELVEGMVGHRTRLAQQDHNHWHDEEDARLDRYLQLTVHQSSISMQLGFIPRGWMILGMIGIAIPLITSPESVPALAVSLGGVMLASQAFVSLEQIRPLIEASSRPRDSQPVVITQDQDDDAHNESDEVVLLTRDINFRYRSLGRLVLKDCSLLIHKGDRILLEGPSGGGKSTLASVLAGLRVPESGLLLLHGFDQKTLGREGWQRRVVSAPQFQENHVFTGTFAFNLLMGRSWPPYPADLQEAEVICHELGLGELLERMPSRFQQMVGESGWQLSHGEQSRLFIARALLQRSDVIILDESFGALDPENLKRAMQCVLNRAKTLIVIAHP
jgi:ATP-binding cassette subfamily B protein